MKKFIVLLLVLAVAMTGLFAVDLATLSGSEQITLTYTINDGLNVFFVESATATTATTNSEFAIGGSYLGIYSISNVAGYALTLEADLLLHEDGVETMGYSLGSYGNVTANGQLVIDASTIATGAAVYRVITPAVSDAQKLNKLAGDYTAQLTLTVAAE